MALFCYVFIINYYFLHNNLYAYENVSNNILFPIIVYNNTLHNQSKGYFKRAVDISDVENWTIPIKYYVNPHMFRQKIDSVLRYLERSTCLKFEESKTEVINGTQLIYRPSTICQSFVKKQKYPYDNYIDLTDGCAHLFGTVAHETFHSLGLLHEHSRYDRDDYLIMYDENVPSDLKRNFFKHRQNSTLVFDTSYDYGSVMQYPNNAFSINGKDTMKARNISQYNKMMGQNSVITFNDLKLINLYYCKGECSHSQRVCKNGGYVMEPRCLHCICPKEYEGDDCSLVKDRSFKCSLEKYTAASYNRTLVAYGEKRCVFHLKASEGKKIILYLTVVRTRDRGICIADFGLEVKYLKDKGCTGLCLCNKIILGCHVF